MPKYSVLYVHMTDENTRTVNKEGWSCRVGEAYLGAQYGEGNDRFAAAIEIGLYVPAASLVAKDLDDVYRRLQNEEKGWHEDRTIWCRADFSRSMMVGDIILDHESGAIWVVASFGFDQVHGPSAIKFDQLFKL